ncbi:MAG TPA: hypothetical protein OIM29_06720 [Oscillospiraceae bacterium]|nr:hypothetical protein [Oscillospiraceae bacterium]
MGTNNINFRYLFEGTFAHLNGLPLNDGTVVNAYWCDDRIVFRSDENRYDLPFSNLLNICIKSDVEIYNQCKLSENLDFIPYGSVGAVLYDKGKETTQATQYLIFTYKGKYNGETKYVAFELNQYNTATANNMVNYFLKLQQNMPKQAVPVEEVEESPEPVVQSYQAPAPPMRKKKKHILLKIFLVVMSISFVIAVVFIISEQGSQPNYKEKNEKAEAEISSLVDGSLSNALSKMEEMGYTATYYFDNGKAYKNDYTNVVKDNFSKDEKQLKKYVITKYENVNAETKTVDLYINTKKEAKKQKQLNELESKLGHINACQAVEKYGKEQYPFGFKLHYMKDLQGYQMVGENNDTWRIQCGVTITNAYGASYDATCQAEITGSNEAPEVTDFVVF